MKLSDLNDDYMRRLPNSPVELAALAAYRDGGLPHALSHEDVTDCLVDMNRALERYIGAWMAEEIVSISERVELDALGIS